MGRKIPLHATVANGVVDEIEEIRKNKAAKGNIVSKSAVVEEILKLGLETYKKRKL